MDDWGETWELPDYPRLPKLFTSAKTAKKRKHKEYIVTDELLEHPVKLPKQGDAGMKHSKKQKQQQQGASTPAADGGAEVARASLKQPKKYTPKQATGQDVPQAVPAAAAAVHGTSAVHAGTKKKMKEKAQGKRQICTVDSSLKHAGQHEPGKAQDNSRADLESAGAAVIRKTGDKRTKQDTASVAAAAAAEQNAATASEGAIAAKVPKKSKNKFKQPEFLEQQQQQQPKQEDKQQPQAQQHKSNATSPGEKTPGASNKNQQQNSRKTVAAATDVSTQQQQQQQQQQHTPAALGGSKSAKKQNGHHAAAAPLASAQQKTAAVSVGGNPSTKHNSLPSGSRGSIKQKLPASANTVAAASKQPGPPSSSRGSKLLQQFKQRLQGSRFRQLNEALYTQPGEDSFAMLQDQPELFQQYHEGFQQQVKSWPAQPLDAAVAWLTSKPTSMVVADFGCGDARLAASVQQQVHSLDLVATAPGVIACNMAHTPLGSSSCDAAVFSLALMGVDYGEFLVEAARVVKQGGWLWIAEVRSRFVGSSGVEDFKPLLDCLQQLGFKLVKQDTTNRMFAVFVLKKQQHQQAPAALAHSIKWPLLKACVYKKR